MGNSILIGKKISIVASSLHLSLHGTQYHFFGMFQAISHLNSFVGYTALVLHPSIFESLLSQKPPHCMDFCGMKSPPDRSHSIG